MNLREQHSRLIKQEAARLGFFHTGISTARFLDEEAPRLESWLKKNYHGTMSYMERHFDKRLDPRILVHGARSVISLLLNYYPRETQQQDAPKVSRYAYGEDYHFVIREKLKQLMQFIAEQIGEVHGRAFTDSAPVLERAWAANSGLGWVGKNSNLIHPKAGSYFFIAEMITDLELDPDPPIKDYCGTCTRCIDACPTDAIIAPKVVDGSRCISYFTIELKDAIPEAVKGKFNDWMFGCDICQEVCPWNRFSKPHSEQAFQAKREILHWNKNDWEEMTEEVFKKVFADSPVQRTGYAGMKRNMLFLNKSR